MKKLDYFIFTIIFLIIIGLSVFYFKKTSVATDTIEIRYKNITLYRNTISDDVSIEIIGKSNKVYLIIDKDNKVEEKDTNIECDLDFTNKLVIENGSVKMLEASCENKNCMHMKLSKNIKIPIVCTNGVVIMYSNNNIEILS